MAESSSIHVPVLCLLVFVRTCLRLPVQDRRPDRDSPFLPIELRDKCLPITQLCLFAIHSTINQHSLLSYLLSIRSACLQVCDTVSLQYSLFQPIASQQGPLGTMDITQYWIRVEAGTSAGSPWPSWASPTSTHPDSSQDVKCLICRRVGDRMMWPIPFLLHCAVRVPCRMCYIRLAAILSITRRNSVRPDLVHSYFYLQNSIMTIVYRRQGQGQIADASMPFFPAESPFTIELYSCPDATSLLPHVGVGRAFMEERTSMYATLTKRRFWECSQNMPLCGPHLQRLPPRVIDVGTLQSPTLRLYETGRDHGAYVVLSHTPSSWPRALRTTTENLLDHVDEVRLFGLPSPIFRDAISVTRGLGIRYLWIGSLCVVQGDEDDRANHIEQYESIYDQARLVISARAENRIHDSGLFPDPNMHRIATIYNGYSTYAVRARLLGEPRGHVCGTSKLIQYNWPWFWNLQDQLLSSRILHFTDSELQWECRCRLACQCTPGSRGLDNSLYLKAWYNHLIDRRLRGHDVDTEVYKFWWFMLHKYSSLDFPSQSDILLSISALARQIQRKLGTGEYVAGMFKNDAPRNLLWKRRMSRFRPIGYVAPSVSHF